MIRATLDTLATGFMAFSDMGFTGVQERDKGIPVQLVVRVRGHEREQGIPVQLGVRVQGREQGIPVQLGVRVQEHLSEAFPGQHVTDKVSRGYGGHGGTVKVITRLRGFQHLAVKNNQGDLVTLACIVTKYVPPPVLGSMPLSKARM